MISNKIKYYQKLYSAQPVSVESKTKCFKRYGISANDFVTEINTWDKNDTSEMREKRFEVFCKEYNIQDFLMFLSDVYEELE